MKLERFEYTCPFCGQEKVTFVNMDMLLDRDYLIQEIFPEEYFPVIYREICKSQICYKCHQETFGKSDDIKEKQPLDADINAPKSELEALEARISKFYDNFERG